MQACARVASAAETSVGGREDGAQGRNRTSDTAIFSRMLYQLSYLGPWRPWGTGEAAGNSGARAACPAVQSSVCSGGAAGMA